MYPATFAAVGVSSSYAAESHAARFAFRQGRPLETVGRQLVRQAKTAKTSVCKTARYITHAQAGTTSGIATSHGNEQRPYSPWETLQGGEGFSRRVARDPTARSQKPRAGRRRWEAQFSPRSEGVTSVRDLVTGQGSASCPWRTCSIARRLGGRSLRDSWLSQSTVRLRLANLLIGRHLPSGKQCSFAR